MAKIQYLDIHRHSAYPHKDVVLVRNLFPDQTDELKNPGYYSVGLHPWHLKEENYVQQLEIVREAANDSKVIAIGEAGLDKVIEVPYELQMKVFKQQIEIAESVQKPLIIHCVRSYNDILYLRKSSNQKVPWIFHWFNSNQQTARELIKKNCYLSFGHMLFNNKSKAHRIFPLLPGERIFLETDDGEKTILEIYERAATLRATTVEKLRDQLINNFETCFNRIHG